MRAWSDRRPEADRRLKLARAAFAALSENLSIPVENLLTPELLRQIAWEPPEPLTSESVSTHLSAGGAREWQCDTTSQVIVDAFVEASQPEVTDDEPTS